MSSWDHNSHYHDLILRELPDEIGTALDIGSGYGDFAIRLAKRARDVDAVETDSRAVSVAKGKCEGLENVNFINDDFLTHPFVADRYDVVSALASLHHMDLEQSLSQAKLVLRPGGTLVVLGLYSESNAVDYAFSAAGVVANRILQWRNSGNATSVSTSTHLRVRAPTDTLAQIETTASRITPGARIKRRLLWRYTLIWNKPHCSHTIDADVHEQ